MPRYADLELNEIKTKYSRPNASVVSRGRKNLTVDLGDGRFATRSTFYPLHDSANNPIDTDWQSIVDGQWRYRVSTADIEISLAPDFSLGQILQWRDIASNEVLALLLSKDKQIYQWIFGELCCGSSMKQCCCQDELRLELLLL